MEICGLYRTRWYGLLSIYYATSSPSRAHGATAGEQSPNFEHYEVFALDLFNYTGTSHGDNFYGVTRNARIVQKIHSPDVQSQRLHDVS